MIVSSRAVVAAGLGVLGVGLLVGTSVGQQPDAAVRKAASQPQPAAAPKPPAPATFGSVDMGAVFKGYDRVKSSSEEFRAAVMGKKNELMKIQAEMQQESEKLAKMTPGSVDAKKIEDRMTQLKAQAEAGRESAEREFALREAEMLATIYKEVQTMVSRVAKHRGITYVLRISNDPITSSNPNSAMMAIERTVVVADPQNDITDEVIRYLNYEYKAKGGAEPKAAAGAAAAGTRPAGN
jgi:Skp family chaperone for outer membrane proteins